MPSERPDATPEPSEAQEEEWINTLLDDLETDWLSTVWDDEDGGGSDTEAQEKIHDRARQAILTKLTEARISEAHECLLNLRDNQECTTCYSNISKVQDHIEQLRVSKEKP